MKHTDEHISFSPDRPCRRQFEQPRDTLVRSSLSLCQSRPASVNALQDPRSPSTPSQQMDRTERRVLCYPDQKNAVAGSRFALRAMSLERKRKTLLTILKLHTNS